MVWPILLMRSLIASNSAAWLSHETLEREKDSSSSESRCKSAACTLMSSSNWVTSLLSSGSPAALVCRWAVNSTANSSATENEQLATTLYLILTPSYFWFAGEAVAGRPWRPQLQWRTGRTNFLAMHAIVQMAGFISMAGQQERKSVSVRGARRLRTTALNCRPLDSHPSRSRLVLGSWTSGTCVCLDPATRVG